MSFALAAASFPDTDFLQLSSLVLLVLNPALLSRSDTLSRWAGFDIIPGFDSPDSVLELKKLLLDLDSYLELLTTAPLLIIVSSSLLELSLAAAVVSF